jgi:hypothetical protein
MKADRTFENSILASSSHHSLPYISSNKRNPSGDWYHKFLHPSVSHPKKKTPRYVYQKSYLITHTSQPLRSLRQNIQQANRRPTNRTRTKILLPPTPPILLHLFRQISNLSILSPFTTIRRMPTRPSRPVSLTPTLFPPRIGKLHFSLPLPTSTSLLTLLRLPNLLLLVSVPRRTPYRTRRRLSKCIRIARHGSRIRSRIRSPSFTMMRSPIPISTPIVGF